MEQMNNAESANVCVHEREIGLQLCLGSSALVLWVHAPGTAESSSIQFTKLQLHSFDALSTGSYAKR